MSTKAGRRSGEVSQEGASRSPAAGAAAAIRAPPGVVRRGAQHRYQCARRLVNASEI